MKMFHVERYVKTLLYKGFLLFFIGVFSISCITPRHTVDVSDYVLLRNGKQVLGQETGLTAFIFENNQRKIPFNQFIANKYNLGTFIDVEYWVTYEGTKFKVMVYENAELEKYFDVSAFMVSSVEPDMNIVGSKANFIAVSAIDQYNQDCLADGSLLQNLVIKYLKELKIEYYNS